MATLQTIPQAFHELETAPPALTQAISRSLALADVVSDEFAEGYRERARQVLSDAEKEYRAALVIMLTSDSLSSRQRESFQYYLSELTCVLATLHADLRAR